MKSRGFKKFLLVLAFWILLIAIWLGNRSNTTKAFNYLQHMKIEKVELRNKFGSLNSRADKSSSSTEIMRAIDRCLDDLEIVHDFRYNEDLDWKKVAFIGEAQTHFIGYATLANKKVVLGSYYEVRHLSGETNKVGLGDGMESICLSELFEKI